MGTHTKIGSATTVIAAKEPAPHPGADRLQGSGKQSVDQAQDGTWVVVSPFMFDNFNRAHYAVFSTWIEAYHHWDGYPGSLLCKNHTPV